MNIDHDRNEFIAESLLDEDDRIAWEQSRAVDLDVAPRAATRAEADAAVAGWLREQHADDVDDAAYYGRRVYHVAAKAARVPVVTVVATFVERDGLTAELVREHLAALGIDGIDIDREAAA